MGAVNNCRFEHQVQQRLGIEIFHVVQSWRHDRKPPLLSANLIAELCFVNNAFAALWPPIDTMDWARRRFPH
jgi:hypothetical protein